ncbi:hypothetical protein BDQ17DRAFT_1371020 [Cyathus striatus]|nr:hypothetical protein BDQ17DRAFT_1379222 [Cyathus striatus]KAF8991237.1 hypothetical protein BDQ17DRAFT_1371020 [Cyathus striatus]
MQGEWIGPLERQARCWAHMPAAPPPVLLFLVVLFAPLAMRLPLPGPFLPCTTFVVPPVHLFVVAVRCCPRP